MQKPLLKIYGERNAGTNYLQALIERNLAVTLLPGVVPPILAKILRRLKLRSEETVIDIYFHLTFQQNLGWKHMLAKPVEQLSRYRACSEDFLFVTLVKNPYSWLLSLYQHPYHQTWVEKPAFETFLVSPWRTVRRENSPKVYANPVELWNQKTLSYLKLQERFPVVMVRYEDLLKDPGSWVAKIGHAVGCRFSTSQFSNVVHSTKEDSKDFLYYQNYYLQEQWRTKLSANSIHLINERLDDQLLSHFAYNKLCGTILSGHVDWRSG